MGKQGEIIVTVAGIRHYIEGGEDGIWEFQRKHPVGSHLYLQLKGGTGAFSRAVIATDAEMKQVGSVASGDSYIARAFFIGEKPAKVEKVTIVEHLPKAIKIAVRDIGQMEREAYVFENEEEYENAFPLTEDEERAMRLSAHICFMANDDMDLENLLPMLIARTREYKEVCMRSISGESMYERRQVAEALQNLLKKTDALYSASEGKNNAMIQASLLELKTLAKDVYEAANDMSKTEYQVRALRMMMSDLRKSSEGALEDYMKSLSFGTESFSQEIERLTSVLKKSLEGKFAEVFDNDERLATLIYYLKYSRRELFLLLTRIIKLEALKAKPAEEKDVNDDERIRTAITKILAMTDKNGNPLMKTQSHWYSIYRVLADNHLGANTMSGFVAYINKLMPSDMRLRVTEGDLKKKNMGCFLKSVSHWQECDAPVKGIVFERFLDIAKAFEELI